ncbi:MAG: PAS domain S-box protein, partial [Bacteroidota bacterium]|nr:PAS domain S-box protein [Bacteroidota bacterium]
MKTKPIKILHIEDDHSEATLVREYLNNEEHLNYELTHAERFSDGIEKLKKNHFDVALLDLSLPDSHGIEAVEHLVGFAPHLPIIALTEISDNGLSLQALQAGAEDYIVKGKVDCALLTRSIRYAIERKRVATLLRISEDRYRTFFESSKDVFYRTDIRGIIQFISQSVKNYGYTIEEVIGKDVTLFYDNPAYRGVLVQKLMTDKSVSDYEITLKSKVGRPIQASLTATLVLDNSNKPIGIDGVLRDITERKEAEQALQQSKEKYKTIVENTHDLIYTCTVDGTITFINPNVAQYGYSQEDIVGRNILEFIQPEDQARIEIEFEETMKTGAEYLYEVRIMKKDGGFFFAEDYGKINWIDGKPAQITGIIRDVTERKRADEVLQESKERAFKQRAAISTLAFDDTITSGDIQMAAHRITEEVSAAIQVERVSVWLLSENSEEMHCIEQFEATERKHSKGIVLISKDYPRYWGAIRAESRINADNAQNDIRTSEFKEGYLIPLGISSMLDIGIQVEGKLIGVLCLEHTGEKRTWFSDEQSFASMAATLLAQTFTNAKRKQAEINLKRREAILETISISAEKFLTAENINEPVNDTLRLLCKATDASRVYIFKFHHSGDGKLLTSQTHESVKEGITPQVDNPELQNLDLISAGYNRWVKTFEKHEPIVGLIKDFPDSEIEILHAQDIQSISVVPIYVSEKLYGFIGFDECLYERSWSKPEIEALQAVANLIAGAIVREENRKELVENEKRL